MRGRLAPSVCRFQFQCGYWCGWRRGWCDGRPHQSRRRVGQILDLGAEVGRVSRFPLAVLNGPLREGVWCLQGVRLFGSLQQGLITRVFSPSLSPLRAWKELWTVTATVWWCCVTFAFLAGFWGQPKLVPGFYGPRLAYRARFE